MRSHRFVTFIFALLASVGGEVLSSEAPRLTQEAWSHLQKGNPVLFSHNPSCPSSKGKQYVNGAVIVNRNADAVWDVVNDPEAAPGYIDELKMAKIVQRKGDSVLVEQGMQVGGFRHLFKYLVRMWPIPQQKVTFRAEGGKVRSMDGGWWIYPLSGGNQVLLVYSLHLDPGMLTPQKVVQTSLKRKVPEALVAVRGEVMRRTSSLANN